MSAEIERIRIFSEFIATTLLVYFGCMGCVNAGNNSSLQASLHFGITYIFILHSFCFLSGAFANPCISIAYYILHKVSLSRLTVYLAAQFAGAFLGYGLLVLILPESAVYGDKPGLCMTVPNKDISAGQAFAMEFFLTTVLLMSCCATWDIRNHRTDSASIRIGFIVTACCLGGGYFTGASMNTARTIAVAVYQKNLESVWIYISSHLLASLVVPNIWRGLFTPSFNVVMPTVVD